MESRRYFTRIRRDKGCDFTTALKGSPRRAAAIAGSARAESIGHGRHAGHLEIRGGRSAGILHGYALNRAQSMTKPRFRRHRDKKPTPGRARRVCESDALSRRRI